MHYYEDGHFWMEVPGLPERDADDESHIFVKQNMKVKFSADPIKVIHIRVKFLSLDTHLSVNF